MVWVCGSVNVFVPLVDVTKENGPTDFFPYVLSCLPSCRRLSASCDPEVVLILIHSLLSGTHHDPAFEALLPEVLQAERAGETHPNCVAPLLTAGSALIFDIR